MPSVLQSWVEDLTFMQQSVLLSSVRGPDNIRKYDPPKMLLRWFRRCMLVSALDQCVLTDPVDPRGGSFTGPSLEVSPTDRLGGTAYNYNVAVWEEGMKEHEAAYIRDLDAIPGHFQRKFMQSCHILGVYHPNARIRSYWKALYLRLVADCHLNPESDEAMAKRLGDNRSQWLERADPATTR